MRIRNILAVLAAVAVLGGAGVAVYHWTQPRPNEKSTVQSRKKRLAQADPEQSAIVSTASSSSSAASSAALPQLITSGTNHIPAADGYTFNAANVRAKMAVAANPSKPKVVFLTFDDGVNTTMTPRVLNVLKQYGVHATFFIVGNTINAQTAPVLKQEYAAGHAIGTHSFTHVYSTLYPKRKADAVAIVREAAASVKALQGVLGESYYPHVWRYPGGHMSWQNLAGADADLDRLHLTWMDWNAAVGDALGKGKTPTTVAGVLKYHAASLNVFPHSAYRVVLMHDAPDKQTTLAALPSIIQYYKNNGYQFGILG